MHQFHRGVDIGNNLGIVMGMVDIVRMMMVKRRYYSLVALLLGKSSAVPG